MSPVLCEYCESSYPDACNYRHHDYVDATYASVEKTIIDMIDKMAKDKKKRIAKCSQCCNQSREETNLHKPDSSLGYSKPEVSLL